MRFRARTSWHLLPGERVESFRRHHHAIVVSNRNEASQKANGVDFGLQYQLPTPSFGTFTWLTQLTYLNSFEVQRVEGGPVEQLAGVTTDPGQSQEGYYRWRGNTSLDWAWKGFDLIGTLRYINGFIEQDADLNTRNVERRWLFDLQASYDFSALVSKTPGPTSSKDGKTSVSTDASGQMSFWDQMLNGTSFTIGCNNVFDQDPPFASGQGGNSVGYPGFTYDATGRFVYVRLMKKF